MENIDICIKFPISIRPLGTNVVIKEKSDCICVYRRIIFSKEKCIRKSTKSEETGKEE
jgi:hypothetical protein